ncbi:MAG: methylmalonyl-CoA mutase family protein [Bacteroidales bacterium]|jgi:methylmalonyl-CoA mutase|nr:methylmalonyl-CoA mutase family protein [Bacteroidales bacterium]
MSDKTEKLFSEFPAVSTSRWEETIQTDLKGADYDKKLKWKTDENFIVNPYYRAEDTENLEYLTESMPGEFPFVRGSQTAANDWKIVQNITETNPQKANAIALDSLKKGADAIAFNASKVASSKDMETLLSGIDLNTVSVRFRGASSYPILAALFVDYIQKQSFDTKKIRGAFSFDPISYLLLNNTFWKSRQEDFAQIKELHNTIGKVCPKFQYITVNGALLHNCGGSIVQELGYSLASANEYLAYATDNGIEADVLLSKTGFEFAVSSNYFMEIAKLRAARLLWASIAEQYCPSDRKDTKMHIYSCSSLWNKTIFDPYVNMLRVTTEGMSAAIGGADEIDLEAFDIAYKESDEFSRRISRNTQILLKEESYFGKIVDPAAGSYYIENLTDAIAEQAWLLFTETEKQGGMIAASEQGKVKENIEKTAQKRDMDIATRRMVFVGTNQYPNIAESMHDKTDRAPETQKYSGLQPYRGAVAFEMLRLNTEKWTAANKRRPCVYLLKIGNVAMRQARAGFITNFFGCAGYDIIDKQGFSDVREGINAAVASQADIVAVCSSDEEYASFAPVVAQGVKAKLPNAQCIVAGNPTEIIDALKSAGIDDFIHVKLNLLETLKRYNQLLGIS